MYDLNNLVNYWFMTPILVWPQMMKMESYTRFWRDLIKYSNCFVLSVRIFLADALQFLSILLSHHRLYLFLWKLKSPLVRLVLRPSIISCTFSSILLHRLLTTYPYPTRHANSKFYSILHGFFSSLIQMLLLSMVWNCS